MTYSIRRVEHLDVTRVEFEGDVDRDHLLEGVRAARELPEHHFRTILVAAPSCVLDLSSQDLRKVAQALLDERPESAPHGRTAIVASSQLAFGLARMAQVFMEDNPSDVRVFHNEDEALDWLSPPG